MHRSTHGPLHPEIAAYARAIGAWRTLAGGGLAYPGSPLIAAMQLRAQDRAVLIELLAEEAGALERALERVLEAERATSRARSSEPKSPDAMERPIAVPTRVRVVAGDGFERLKAFLPPPERRGLTLIDPPYEQTPEISRVDAALVEALRRFETGVIAVWYPIKDHRDTAAWHDRLRPRIARETLVSELWLHPCDSRVALNGSGLLIVNPPYGIAERMREWLPALHAMLDPAGHAAPPDAAHGPAGNPPARSTRRTARSASGTSVRLL